MSSLTTAVTRICVLQLLRITKDNCSSAVWITILSQLPFIYSHLTIANIEAVAMALTEATLQGNQETGSLSLSVAQCFSSPWFQEMVELHEALVNGCFSCVSCLLPKQLANKKWLLLAS